MSINEKPTFAKTNAGNGTIKIAGYLIEVANVPDLMLECECYGEYVTAKQLIRLDANLTKQQHQETLIHEVLEAVNHIYDLGLNHENQLCKLSVVLHQILTDNQDLLGYLSE